MKKSDARGRPDHEGRGALFRDFIEFTDELFVELDADGVIRYINQAAERVYGLPAETCVGRPAVSFIHPGDREATRSRFARWIRAHVERATLENRQQRQDGTVTNVLWTLSFHYGADRRLRQIRGLGRDISDRIQVEEMLRASLKRYRDLFDNARDAIFILDEDYRYVDVNRGATKIFGYTREEFLNMSIFDLIPEEQAPRSADEFKTLRGEGGYRMFVGRMRRRNGTWAEVEVNSSAIYDGSRIAGSWDIVRDISERRESPANNSLDRHLSEILLRIEAARSIVAEGHEAREHLDRADAAVAAARVSTRRTAGAPDDPEPPEKAEHG